MLVLTVPRARGSALVAAGLALLAFESDENARFTFRSEPDRFAIELSSEPLDAMARYIISELGVSDFSFNHFSREHEPESCFVCQAVKAYALSRAATCGRFSAVPIPKKSAMTGDFIHVAENFARVRVRLPNCTPYALLFYVSMQHFFSRGWEAYTHPVERRIDFDKLLELSRLVHHHPRARQLASVDCVTADRVARAALISPYKAFTTLTMLAR